jgi:preprotein translocase subunit SecE
MNPIHSLIHYMRSAKSELEKVSWPSRQDTIRYTSLVVGVSVVVALFFAALDFGLGKTVEAVLIRRAPGAEAPAPTAPIQPITPDLNLEPIGVEGALPDGSKTNLKVEEVAPGTVTTPENKKN